MPNPRKNDDLIAFVICGAIILWFLYYLWVYVVGFLALCGAYYIYQEFWNKPRN